MKNTTFFTPFFLYLFPAVLNAQTAPQEPIIDVHAHAFPDGHPWFREKTPNELTGQPMTATDFAAHEKASLDEMQRLGIVKAVVSGDYQSALQWKKDAPDKVIVGISIGDPTKMDLDFLRKEHAAGRLQVIGEVASQYSGIAPNDPRMEPLFALAEELDVPIGLHLFPGGPPGTPYLPGAKLRARLGDPLLLEEVLVRHPRLRIYLMHAAWPFLDHLIALMYAYPNVHVEVGVISWALPRKEFHRYLRALVEAGYSRRIMFGSDQMVWPETFEMAVDAVKSADFLTLAQRSDILYHNAARFLRLEPTTRVAPPGASEDVPRE